MKNVNRAPRRQHMIGRRQELQQVLSYVDAGFDVEILGKRSSGRSELLRAVSEGLRENGWHVLNLVGVPGTEGLPLASFSLAGLNGSLPSTSESLVLTVQNLVTLTEQGRLAVLVDDASYLADLGWGALASARAQAAFPIVSISDALEMSDSDGGAGSVVMGSALTLDLEALPFHDMILLLERRFDGVFEPHSASRIYAKSAGIPGLALAIAAVARESGTLFVKDGEWFAADDLWNPALSGVVKVMFAGVSEPDLLALERLALAGLLTLDDGVRLVGEEAMQRLNHLGLVENYQAGAQHWSAVVPPIAQSISDTVVPQPSARSLSSCNLLRLDAKPRQRRRA